jgi:hypothetical protein
MRLMRMDIGVIARGRRRQFKPRDFADDGIARAFQRSSYPCRRVTFSPHFRERGDTLIVP